MTTPTTAELLKYADLQMAAEAFLANPDGTIRTDLKEALIDGNKHSSKFTAIQATAFLDPNDGWTVVAQKPNTPTGFSGTLFKNNKTGELVMSFRSTEFIDDAAASCGTWKRGTPNFNLPASSLPTKPSTSPATAFNMMHETAAQVVTFNGAGIGGIAPNTTLKSLLKTFTELSAGDYSSKFTDTSLKALYARASIAIKGGGNDCRWRNRITPKSIAACACCIRARGPFGIKTPTHNAY